MISLILFQLLQSIKGVSSPVFASKMGHFIRSDIFPVIDGEVIGIKQDSYKYYWLEVKSLWLDTKNKESLIPILGD